MTAMRARPAGSTTASWTLVSTQARSKGRGLGAPKSSTSARTRSMNAGLVPQHPPTMLAPASSMRSIACANDAGSTSYTVRPPSMRGRPALGCTSTGQRAKRVMACAAPSSSSGPSEQLRPTACAPMDDSVTAATSGGVPRNVRPSSPNVIVANTGRSQRSRAASSAAFASRRSAIVSMSTRSQPAAHTASTCSANKPYASSNVQVPNGSSSTPKGPMSPAT